MIVEIKPLSNINLAPKTLIEEVIQNVQTILNTPKGSVPLERDFGIDWTFVDMPQMQSQILLKREIIRALKEYEPRVVVKTIRFKQSNAADGQLIPILDLEVLNA